MRRITPSRPNVYSGGTWDRAATSRADEVFLETARRDPSSRFVLFNAGRTRIIAEAPRRVSLAAPPEDDVAWVFLGLWDKVPIFAAEVADEAGVWAELRDAAASLSADEASLLAAARGLLHWRAKNRFCAVCGGDNLPRAGGHVLHCTRCGADHFPRSDPAVIMLVTRGEKMLLGQSHRFPKDVNWYSALAGFVEPGENLEDAVRREVLEEVGVQVGEVAYHSSQPWPFPASLMIGFYAEALSEEIVLEVAEMRAARWFTAGEVADRVALGFDLPPETSIARRLIDDWLA